MKIARFRDVKMPTRGTDGSAGLDFYVPNSYEWECKTLRPGESIIIPSGILVAIPKNHALIAFNKSGVATKKGLQVGACVVDEDYQGEIHIHLTNVSRAEAHIKAGEKIVQFLLVPVCYPTVEEVDASYIFSEVSERGEGGFGSTGIE